MANATKATKAELHMYLNWKAQAELELANGVKTTNHKLIEESKKTLAQLEENFDVHIVTQNVDDLHERAGSTKVLHLHGELMKSRSTKDESLIFDIQGIFFEEF